MEFWNILNCIVLYGLSLYCITMCNVDPSNSVLPWVVEFIFQIPSHGQEIYVWHLRTKYFRENPNQFQNSTSMCLQCNWGTFNTRLREWPCYFVVKGHSRVCELLCSAILTWEGNKCLNMNPAPFTFDAWYFVKCRVLCPAWIIIRWG